GRFELRRRQEHAALEHAVEVTRVALGVGALGRGVVGHGRIAEEARQHRADAVDGQRHARALGPGAESALELGAERIEAPIDVAVAQARQGRQPGGDRERVARQGAGLIDGAERRHVAHELARSPVGADGQPTADDFAQTRDVRAYAVELLRAAERDAEPGDDLVEDQYGIVRTRNLAQAFEESRARRHDAHVAGYGLDDDRRDVAPALSEDRLHRI